MIIKRSTILLALSVALVSVAGCGVANPKQQLIVMDSSQRTGTPDIRLKDDGLIDADGHLTPAFKKTLKEKADEAEKRNEILTVIVPVSRWGKMYFNGVLMKQFTVVSTNIWSIGAQTPGGDWILRSASKDKAIGNPWFQQ
jgi:hypothetical protein